MLHTLKVFGYRGELLETIQVEGHRGNVCQAIADYAGAASAEVTNERGRTETIGKGIAFGVVDGPARKRSAVVRDKRTSYNDPEVRSPRAWYGAAALA